MPEFDSNVRKYYECGLEATRLSGGFPSGPLELERTKEIITRYLPPPSLRILDVGGGPGVYAAWLADRGDQVHLVDPIPLHLDQARSASPKITVEAGDARKLTQSDASVDVVLLLGPLYHLIDRRDRLQALSEARRVLRPGGVTFVAAISRYAPLLDLLVRADRLHEHEIFHIVREAVETGVFRGQVAQLFTTAYLHLPEEFREEIRDAGFEVSVLLNVEGPGSLLQDFERRWEDPSKRDAILNAARLVESRPELLAASAHLLAVARSAG